VACKTLPLPLLQTLDLSHNRLADLSCFIEGARGAGDFPSLSRLDLSHNCS
jgi:Leucine-rich repeat (LRR) protein